MIFKKNSALLGLFLGFFIPIIVYVLQENIIPVIMGRGFSKQSMQLFALVVNVPFFRYYLIKLKYEDTGRGILFATFIYALMWVYLNQHFF